MFQQWVNRWSACKDDPKTPGARKSNHGRCRLSSFFSFLLTNSHGCRANSMLYCCTHRSRSTQSKGISTIIKVHNINQSDSNRIQAQGAAEAAGAFPHLLRIRSSHLNGWRLRVCEFISGKEGPVCIVQQLQSTAAKTVPPYNAVCWSSDKALLGPWDRPLHSPMRYDAVPEHRSIPAN